MRFLIIDDEASICMVMQDILEAQGFEVITAANVSGDGVNQPVRDGVKTSHFEWV